ncbi:hypothetical protein C8J56DRAFT_1166407 [Mycena floridula]|nr:hypothetical protein C8J56DRAFT_1169684 [Mycena floridula]KAJ7585289.1 hypothetical protein C8J56DRAFT_1166407 [Mycena floridula]
MASVPVQFQIRSALLGCIIIAVECCFYAASSVLFFISLRVLWKRRDVQKRNLACMTALYGLTTVHLVLAFIMVIKSAGPTWDQVNLTRAYQPFISAGNDSLKGLATGIKVLFFITNLLADAVLINRCYVIWGMRKRFIIVPAFTYICMIILLFVQIALNTVSFILAFLVAVGFLTSLISVCLTAGRIWWIHKARNALGDRIGNWFKTTTAVILDSGLLYLVAIIGGLLTVITGGSVETGIFVAIMYQAVGIAPTLMILRISLGVAHDSVGQFKESDSKSDV